MSHPAPYGSWLSPISAALAGAGSFRVSNHQLKVDGATVYWTDQRPKERGRNVLMRRTAEGQVEDVTPPGFNVRSTVHEYGGGAFAVKQDIIVFVNYADQQLYRQAGGDPSRITHREGKRYADMELDLPRNRLVCVREDHTGGGREPVNTLVSVNLAGDEAGTVLVEGADFYASPRLSPDGTRLAYMLWHHPNMPWDGSELWVAEVNADGSLGRHQKVAGGPTESVFQPEWSPSGVLHFVAEPTGWWNLYRWRDGQVEALCPMEAEFGQPQWAFGLSTYGFLTEDRLVCAYAVTGLWQLAVLDTTTGMLTPIQTPYSEIASVRVANTPSPLVGKGAGGWGSATHVYFAAGSPHNPPVVAMWETDANRVTPIYRATETTVDPGYLSIPQAIEFPTTGGLTAYGFYYPPQNKDYTGIPGEKPPLIVISHGGPTSATTAKFDLVYQFWTSRGFAILDVNYGGSAGYGRAYRQRLNHGWGVVDVDDCVYGALHLVRQGLADGERLIIRGGSAGGYTTLCALTFRDVFKAGASYYGISDHELLDETTHKFESRYNHTMIGPYPAQRDVYRARSPIYHVENLACPVIFFQGLEDKVVPPSQAEVMVEALRRKGIPVAYLPLEGEQHGFRKAENIQRTLEAELYFYARIFGFALPETTTTVTIDNL